MNRFALPLAVFVALVAVLAIGIRHSPQKGVIPSPLIGKPAPSFQLPNLADAAHPVASQDLRGRWYVLNVWGTWCVECRAEHQMLIAARDAHAVPLIGLDWKDDDARARDWLAQLGNPYEVVALDHSGNTAVDYGVYGAPESFLVNAQGIIVYKYVGPLTREVWEKEFLARLPARAAAGS
ncbi:MAG: DsbE family thiol:disulfide interchange protein [Steroidobacteraceae bacterium]